MDQDKSVTQECYEFLDLSDVNDTERSQLATTLYPGEKQQAHFSWVHDTAHHHRQQQHQNAFSGAQRFPQQQQQQQQEQEDGGCQQQELEHDPAVINSWNEAPYGQATATPLVRSLMPRLIPPLAAAAALPIYAIVKPTLAPLAAVPLSMPAVAGAAVNGNTYDKTPSETETESSVTTDYTDFAHQQHQVQQQQQQQQQQQSSTEMSPHSHHQHQTHHHSQASQQQQQQQISGQNPGGQQHTSLANMYSAGNQIGQPAYMSQGSHVYQMVQPPIPSNVYVSNVTANVNFHHSFMGAQMPQTYMSNAGPAFMPNEMAGAQSMVAPPTSHDTPPVHQPPPIRMGGARRGRGNKSSGSHRRGGGDYASRQQQDQQQQQQQQQRQEQQQRQQQQSGSGGPQEMMQHMIDPQQVMGTPGYAPQMYYNYTPYYPPPNLMPHPSAQHAAGHPLYLQGHPMHMYTAGTPQMAYGQPHGMFMYPQAMMSPPEYSVIDDKGDDQSVLSDGSVVGQIWTPQMQMEFAMEPNIGAGPGQEEYLVPPDMMEDPMNPNALMMISPQHPPANPQTSHHVLNPDVANFMTMKQQMEQQAQQQDEMIVHQHQMSQPPPDYLHSTAVVKSVVHTPNSLPAPIATPIENTELVTVPQEMIVAPLKVDGGDELEVIPQQNAEKPKEVVEEVEVVVVAEKVNEPPPVIMPVESIPQPDIGRDAAAAAVALHSPPVNSHPSTTAVISKCTKGSSVEYPQNVAANNNNNNITVKSKECTQDDVGRLAKITNDKLMLKNERGQKPPAWSKKSTTSVSVTALPPSTLITTSQTLTSTEPKQQTTKVSPPPFANQKAPAKALLNVTAQVPKGMEGDSKVLNQNDAAACQSDAIADKKTEVSTLLNKTVQAIPMQHHVVVNVETKQQTVTTFESKQVEVLPQVQEKSSSSEMCVEVTKVTTNGTAVESAAAKGEPTVAVAAVPQLGVSVATAQAPAIAAPPPSKSWASLFSSDTSSSALGHATNKKPVAKVPPFEPTQSLPIGGLSYSAASALGLPSPQVAATETKVAAIKPTKSTVDDRCFKLGEFLSKYQIDNSSVILCPRGLTNRSNFCYINAILQALVACPPFYHMMKKLPLEPLAFRQKNSTPIIDAMVELVSEFSTMPPGARLGKREKGSKGKDEIDLMCDMAFEPTVIHKMLSNSRSEFHVEGRQEDAEEFLGFILNGLNDEMLELIKLVEKQSNISNGEQANGEVPTEEGGGDDWQVIYGNRNKGTVTRTTDFGRTPISDIFGGQLRSRVQREGDHSTDVIQPFFTLQLDIEKAESVKEALEILVVKDQLEGVTCSKTNQEVAAWQQVTLEKLPVVLILHLKWFDYKMDSCTKILKTVEFPIELRVDTKILSSKKCVPKQRQYKLFAVVYHDGKEASKGHYITDVFNIGYASWIRYDDSTVRSVSEQTVLHPHLPKVPYLLYYRRCDTIGTQGQSAATGK